MEEITEQEAKEMIEQGKEELQKILDEGGKITDIIVREKERVTTTRKIEPAEGKSTSSTIILNEDSINLQIQ